MLTADHGVTPVVERSKVSGARRIRTDEIARAVESVLEPRMGKGPWVAQIASGNVYLSAAFGNAPAIARDDALSAAADAVGRIPGVATAARSDRLAGPCDARAPLLRALCLSVVPGESGELVVVPTAGSVITNFTSGSHHDAPFDDNRRVPILVLAPGLAPQAGTGSLLQVAPTVAALLGVPPPPAATAPPLFGLRARASAPAPALALLASERLREERRAGGERRDVVADVVARRGRQLGERRDVLVGDVAEREVDPARAEALDRGRQIEAELVVDALDAVEQVVLPPRAAEHLERAVLEPLRADGRGTVTAGAAPHELEPRALAERERGDGAGLEVAVLADARGVDGLAAPRGGRRRS